MIESQLPWEYTTAINEQNVTLTKPSILTSLLNVIVRFQLYIQVILFF